MELTVDSAENVYVIDDQIKKYNRAGALAWSYERGKALYREGIAYKDSSVYVAKDKQIIKINPSGAAVWTQTLTIYGESISVDNDEYVYIGSSRGENKVCKLTAAGAKVWESVILYDISASCKNNKGGMYVSCGGYGTYNVASNGTQTKIAAYTMGLHGVDTMGNMYDSENMMVTKYNPSGVKVWGHMCAGIGWNRLSIDPSDHILVSNYWLDGDSTSSARGEEIMKITVDNYRMWTMSDTRTAAYARCTSSGVPGVVFVGDDDGNIRKYREIYKNYKK